MPLDARKIARIKANIARLRAGRVQTVTLTIKAQNGSTNILTVPCIFRLAEDIDPALAPARGLPSTISTNTPDVDAVASFLITDVSYQQLRATVYLDLPNGSPGVVMNTRYLISNLEPRGMLPGADRLTVGLVRQR